MSPKRHGRRLESKNKLKFIMQGEIVSVVSLSCLYEESQCV